MTRQREGHFAPMTEGESKGLRHLQFLRGGGFTGALVNFSRHSVVVLWPIVSTLNHVASGVDRPYI